ncbi:carboxylating nicotinate-nucleotide diphosphorylase [bacterium]|nr:MAG: carboxylating nicotinate-nucleotide diphosphorylase [bacterium]
MDKKKSVHHAHVRAVILKALTEDIGSGDVTSGAVITKNHRSTASLIAKEDFVLAGLPFAEDVFKLIDEGLTFKTVKKDGDTVKKGSVIVNITGNTRNLLKGERTSLNFLQRLSGIATMTRMFVERVQGFPVKITDTRKTTPGLRFFEKYAVRIGGGVNHRSGLFDGILIKDNHIQAAGGIRKAVKLARNHAHHLLKIEVEVKNIREVKSALLSDADIIMLDNMSILNMEKSVALIRGVNPRVVVEASGNINLDNIARIAATGVDLISVGALTHSAGSVDISMDIKPS